MSPFLLIKGELKRSAGGVLAAALVLALACSLGVGVSVSERAIRQGMAKAGDDFDLLIGGRGSPTQLVLGTVYLRPENLPLLDGGALRRVRAQPGTAWAAPLAFGDRWNQTPLVGTSAELITLGGTRGLAEGRLFSGPREAVAGAAVPLRPGQAFIPAHGRIAVPGSKVPEHESYTVVGRLPATGTPWDNVLLVPVEAVWAEHGLDPADEPGVSAVVVKPASVADAYKLRAAWNTPTTGAVFTGEVLTELFAALGGVSQIMQGMAACCQAVALGAALLAGFFAVSLRRRLLALLRALGAPRAYLILSVWLLVSLTIGLGGLAGLGLGWGIALALAEAVRAETGVLLPTGLTGTELLLTLVTVGAGSLFALFPALSAYRRTAGGMLR